MTAGSFVGFISFLPGLPRFLGWFLSFFAVMGFLYYSGMGFSQYVLLGQESKNARKSRFAGNLFEPAQKAQVRPAEKPFPQCFRFFNLEYAFSEEQADKRF
jgi:hypothetical protein